jgi:hypothetical protein
MSEIRRSSERGGMYRKSCGDFKTKDSDSEDSREGWLDQIGGVLALSRVFPGDFLTCELVSDIVKNLYASVKSEQYQPTKVQYPKSRSNLLSKHKKTVTCVKSE